MAIYCPDIHDVDDVAHFAVAFNSHHVGMVFRGDKNERMFWHLGAHNEVWLEPAKRFIHGHGYSWVIPPLRQIELRGLANFCVHYSENIKPGYKLPYGVRYLPEGYRYKDDLTVEFNGMSGFTCATFVMSVFDALIAPYLLDHSTWVKRATDSDEFEKLVQQAVGERATPEYIATLREEIPKAFRFKPHEVAGACIEEARPVSMQTAESRAKEIQQAITDYEDRKERSGKHQGECG